MILWLWEAPGSGRSGVSDDEKRARKTAGALLRAGHADRARVEAAVAELGIRTLSAGYQRTGCGWLAVRGPGGRVRWTPLTERSG